MQVLLPSSARLLPLREMNLQMVRATPFDFRNCVHRLFHGFHAEIDRAFVEKRVSGRRHGDSDTQRAISRNFNAQGIK